MWFRMVLLGVVIRRCETPTTNISQENGHGILVITCQIVATKFATSFCCLSSMLVEILPKMLVIRDAGTGGQEGQLPPLPFAGRGKGGKSAL